MNEQQRAIEAEVRDLLERAGPRAVVPAEDVSAIKAAAREEWRALVATERRRRARVRLRGGLALAASVLLALVAGWWWVSRSTPATAVAATVELVRGEARIEGAAEALAIGGELATGATLETGGWAGDAPARVALRLADGQSVRLDADSRVRLASGRRLELERGALYLDSGAAPAAGAVMAIVTPLGTVRDIGTQFEVRLSEGETAIRVRVREGRVSLDAAGESHLAGDGEQLSLLRNGSVVRAAVERYGPDWRWVVAAAPPPRLVGGSLESFLDYFARETGRQVRFADAATEAVVAATLVHAPADSLTPPDRTIESVLDASGLDYRIEDGSVLISGGSR